MNADRLLFHFDRIADAPDSIKRLRRFILDLAVRGKLVEQDPNDEPASELLKRIAAEKARLVKGGKVRVIASILSGRPFESDSPIPAAWKSVRLAELSNIVMGQSPPSETYNTYGEGVPLINGPVEFSDGPFGMTVANQYTTAPTNSCDKGDFLICVRGSTTGRSNIAAFDACIGRGVAAIQPLFGDGFVRLFLWSMRERIISMGRGVAFPSITRKQLENLLVPLPPLAEQHRIVAKVDELMALCDRLEAARAEREAMRDRMAAANLARLNVPDPDHATFRNHAGFAIENLAPLTTRVDQIKQLRQTILNLAVRGKLVKQDPNDEPASELLCRLRTNTDGKSRRKARNSEDIDADEVPFECPAGWMWTNVQQTLNPDREISYGVIKLGDEPRSGGIPILRCSDMRAGFIDLSGVRKVDEAIESEYARTRLLGGEVVINIRGTLGGVALVPHELKGFNVAREVAVVPIANEISGSFVVYLMLSPDFWDHIQNNLRGIAYKGLNLGILRELPIPVPPLAEQHRIVAKVDELMALCDQIEESLTTGDDARRRLLDALLRETLESTPDRVVTA